MRATRLRLALSPPPARADHEVDLRAAGPHRAELGLLRDHVALGPGLPRAGVNASDLPRSAVDARELPLRVRQLHASDVLHVAETRGVDQDRDSVGLVSPRDQVWRG